MSNQVQSLQDYGYFVVRQGFPKETVEKMSDRLNSITSGHYPISGRRFQVNSDSDKYEDIDVTNSSYKGPNVNYRKICNLEYDEVILEKLQSSWIRHICFTFLGETTSIMRCTMMNKPARGGSFLPWHQDVSLSWPNAVQPRLAIWIPLDEASTASGSLQVIPSSHKHGIIANGHLLPDDLKDQYAPEKDIYTVEASVGDVLFFDCQLLHRSGINKTLNPRRAINIILMPGEVVDLKRNRPYPVLFGLNRLRPEYVKGLSKIPE